MDKIFDVEIDGQVTLPDGSTLGPLEETTVNVVQPSEGGSDPVVENAKETGGFGWTEQGEQTVITWDGDTDGRDVLTIIDSEHPDDVIRMYKVAEYSSKPFTENCELFAAGIQFPVSLYTYDNAELYAGDSPFAIRTDGTDFDIPGVGTAHAESSGIYFLEMGGAYVESLTYGTPDTVHKIDPKYLGGGGATVVHFNIAIGEGAAIVTADKTPDDVVGLMMAGSVVYGVASGILGEKPLGYAMIDADNEPAFLFIEVDEYRQARYLIQTTENGDWEANLA